MVNKRRLIALLLVGLMIISPISTVKGEVKSSVRVDFSKHTGTPLLKRQNTFSVSYSFGLGGDSATFMKSSQFLTELRSENMRVDFSMGTGGLGKYFAQGSIKKMKNQYTALDVLLKQLYKKGTQPYYEYGYMPPLLQPDDGDFRSPPRDYDAWQRLCYDIAKHYADKGWPAAAHEIWNEPDLGDPNNKVFYNGTWDEYIKMYEYGVNGIRAANPDATVGGLSLAFVQYFDQNDIRKFLNHVDAKDLPLDFLSYHNYSTTRYLNETKTMNAILSSYGDRFANVALHLNEFHVVDTAGATTYKSSCADSASLAMEAITRLVEMPTVTSVNWATWRCEGTGLNMVGNDKAERYALFHALRVYNDMPIDRVEFNGAKYVQGFASADEQSAGVLMYTRAVKDQTVTVDLAGLPFDRVDVRAYAIDKQHSSILDGCETDELEMISEMKDVPADSLTWVGTLGARGILYLKITPAGQEEYQKAVWSVDRDTVLAGETATVTRKEYYFEDRSSTSFSEFDLGTFSAWAGMGNREKGMAKGAVLLENIPAHLNVNPIFYGDWQADAKAFLYAQYTDKDGKIVKKQAFRLGDDPWIAEGFDGFAADTLAAGQKIVLDTPEGFEGTLKLTWGLQDAGMDTSLKLRIEK